MIKSILVALDDSDSGREALLVGIDIAKRTNSNLKGLYVEDITKLLEWQPVELMTAAITPSTYIPQGRPTEEQIEIEKQFVKDGNKLEKFFKDETEKNKIKGTFSIKRGKVEDLIIQASRTVDLVVIGKRGKTYPLESKAPGPVTELLLRHTTKPVVVVPQGGKLNNKILIGYDGSKTSQRALASGATLATYFNSSVVVVSIANEIDEATSPLNEAKEFLSNYQLDVTYIVDFGSTKPWTAILDQARIHGVSLIVIGAYGDNKLLELIFGSTTREVLIQATCPVLLAK